VSRFLIVRLGALGDIVHALPVAAALRRAFPSATIDWLVSARHSDFLNLTPVVDRQLVIQDRGQGSGVASLPAIIRKLRRNRYDVALDLVGFVM
jgi:heptosyltransferase-1